MQLEQTIRAALAQPGVAAAGLGLAKRYGPRVLKAVRRSGLPLPLLLVGVGAAVAWKVYTGRRPVQTPPIH